VSSRIDGSKTICALDPAAIVVGIHQYYHCKHQPVVVIVVVVAAAVVAAVVVVAINIIIIIIVVSLELRSSEP
jgi:hypothetical protein